MLEQIDHRGKRFTIGDEDIVDHVARDRCRRAELLERQAQREIRELEAVHPTFLTYQDKNRTVILRG